MSEIRLLTGEEFKNQLLGKMQGQKPHSWGKDRGIDRGVIDRILKGKIPDPHNLLKLANVLSVSTDWLLTGREGGQEKVFAREEPAPYIARNKQEEEIIELWRRAKPEIRRAARAVLESGGQTRKQ